jgi:ribosomal protein L11 methyltransferase
MSRGNAGPDPFVAVRFDVDAADGDRWSDALLAAGALCVDASDPAAGTRDESAIFAEPEAGDPAWWPVTRLTALCATGADGSAVVATAAQALGQAPPVCEAYPVADRDWVTATQAQFGPIRIDERLWIVPTWCKPPRPDAVNLVIDPGLAFGTGAHPTTRLCLRWLVQNVTADTSVLDYGCGSGILAIAAAKLGAPHVVGCDIDAQALAASTDNAAANAVAPRFVHVDTLAPGAFALVVANILANPLRVLAPALAARTRSGGRIALSGILASQADGVIDAYSGWFDIRVWQADDGWVLLSGTRRPSDDPPR